MDRILYIDSGDVLIIDDIDEYYFGSFDNNMLIATSILYKNENDMPVLFENLDIFSFTKFIARGIFNSGCYVINLNKMRQQNFNVKDYKIFSELFSQATKTFSKAYFGDQGFLSLLFVGDLKIFAYPQIADIWYMPYNFCMWYYDKKTSKPNYKVSIIHYAGCAFKPWMGQYPIFLERFQDREKLRNLSELKLGQSEYYYLWHKYAIKTNNRLDKLRIKGL